MLVDEGEHRVEVIKMSHAPDKQRVTAQFTVLEGSDFEGMSIYENFGLNTMPGTRMFKDFLEAISVNPENGTVDIQQCEGKVLVVRVKHRQGDGTVYANVVEHRPDF
jgi:hypothetical protein